VRFGRPLEIGTRVQLEGLPDKRNIIARVVNCLSLGQYEKFWFLGLALDEPGNVWGIENPPADWR
jgi:hypothetical protein